MPVKQQKKPLLQKKPQQQKKKVGFFKRCADVAVVLNLLLPILISLFLIATLVYALAKKKSTASLFIYPILFGLFVLFLLIGITLLLYKYFPDALCVLFLVNLVFSFFTLASVPFGHDGDEKKKKK